MKITTTEMEIVLARHFNFRQNLIVPNVSWGLYVNGNTLHECDLLVCTGSNYLWECEIKVSRSDLIADKKKLHGHISPLIKRLYFAIPEHMEKDIEHIPERAGIILVKKRTRLFCKQIRKPKVQKGTQISEKDRYQIARLGSMRIWALKNRLVKAKAA